MGLNNVMLANLPNSLWDMKHPVRASSHEVPSPNMEAKSKLVNLKEPLKYG